MTDKSDWLAEFDYLRALAILAVLVIHSSAYFLKIGQVNLLEIANVIVSGTFTLLFRFLYLFQDSFSITGIRIHSQQLGSTRDDLSRLCPPT